MEVVFLTDLDGIIEAVGRADDWDRFAAENDAPELLDHSLMVGRPLLDFIAGAPTQAATRTLLYQLRTGVRATVSYPYSCDSPDVARTMRMTITRRGRSLEFRSSLLSERTRMVRAVLGFTPNSDRLDLPLVTICSVCKRVEDPGKANNWLDAEAYERDGGNTNVRVSHGLCESCMESLLNVSAS